MHDNYALILAGGSGTRFWPLSRNSKPKQFLRLFDEETLIEKTISRLEGLIPKKNVIILTNELQRQTLEDILPCFPKENIFTEPEKRDTAPAITYGISIIAKRNQNAKMLVLPSDQLITDVTSFQKVMLASLEASVEQNALVTVGIKPTFASPSFGYIERGEQRTSCQNLEVHKVSRFREKPSVKLAESFLKNGNFSWNAGMFIWEVTTVIKELTLHNPELSHFIHGFIETSNEEEFLNENFSQLESLSIDYALMEKSENILNLEATFDWDDVGSWISAATYFESDDTNKTNSKLTTLESHGNIVYTDKKHVGLLNVSDLIIVQTEDSILIANKNKAENIKKLVSDLPKSLT